MPSALLIEDDPANQAVIAVMLARCGYDVRTIGSVREASELAKHQFDVVIADIVLRDGSGETAAQAIGATAGLLFISGWPVSDLWDRGLLPPSALERQHFLTKPFTFGELRERLTQLIAIAGQSVHEDFGGREAKVPQVVAARDGWVQAALASDCPP
jgi:CheY-like chemotaxis protein